MLKSSRNKVINRHAQFNYAGGWNMFLIINSKILNFIAEGFIKFIKLHCFISNWPFTKLLGWDLTRSRNYTIVLNSQNNSKTSHLGN
jgi:hypothetical protein